MTRIIAEIGSCHNGSLETALALIDAAADAGVWGCKFQLFPDRSEFTGTGNVVLPLDWLPHLLKRGKERGVAVFCSTFGDSIEQEGYMRHLYDLGVGVCKVAFPHRRRTDVIRMALATFGEVIVSTSPMDRHLLPDHPNLTTLFCHSHGDEPAYAFAELLDFEEIFKPTYGFHGYSHNGLGLRNVRQAIAHGAEVVELHVMADDAPRGNPPDSRFSVRFRDIKLALPRVLA